MTKLLLQDVQQMPASHLAYIGDALYELAVRKRFLGSGEIRIEQLHQFTVQRVRAPAQAAAARILLPQLTEAEEAIFYRGRNVKPARVPKNSTVGEYCYSTALEALFGYLYLTDQMERLQVLISMAMAVEPPTE